MDIITEEFCCDLEACKGKCCIEGDAGAPVTLDEIMQLENVLDTVWPDLSASAQAVIDKQGVAYTDREGDLVTSIVNGKDCVFTYYDDLKLDATTQPNDQTTKQPNDQTTKQPNDQTTKQPNNQTTKQPNNQTTKQPNDQTTKQPNDQTTKQPNDQTTKQPKVVHCCLCATEKAFRAGKTTWCKPISCALYPIRVKKLSNGLTALNYHRWDICKDGIRKGRELHLPVYQFLRDPLIRQFGEAWYTELCTVADEIKKQGIC